MGSTKVSCLISHSSSKYCVGRITLSFFLRAFNFRFRVNLEPAAYSRSVQVPVLQKEAEVIVSQVISETAYCCDSIFNGQLN